MPLIRTNSALIARHPSPGQDSEKNINFEKKLSEFYVHCF